MAANERHPGSHDRNPDPVTGEPGSHPIGTGLGTATGGLAAGAAAGALGGPIGAAAGAVIGSVAGGLLGKEVAEQFDPTEDQFWRENYRSRPYIDESTDYETIRPAYQYGYESHRKYPNRRFDEVESDLASGWHQTKQKTSLGWAKAKHAARDAWDRVERALPGDADRDGK